MEFREAISLVKLKDKISTTRHGEKKEMALLRSKLVLEILGKRDKYAEKRHKERIDILAQKI